MVGHHISGWRRIAKLGGTLSLKRVGRRGTALAILAILDISYGTSLLAGHIPAATIADEILPLTWWGWTWISIGLFLATGIPRVADHWQFAVAALFKSFWALMITWYWVTHHTHGGWGAAGTWLGLAAMVLLISGWPEPLHD